ncbi:MAG: hypothetical protein ACJ73E_02525 [Mycobacteriales bacterium]
MTTSEISARDRRPPPALTESEVLAMSNAALDELFRASPAGVVPDGTMRGTVVALPGTPLAAPVAALTHALLWQGKVVNRRRGVLKNRLTPLRLRLVKALVGSGPSWVDARACIVLDYSRTSLVARLVRDELRLVGPHLYLGVVWLARRRVLWFTLRDQSGG